MCVCGGDDKFLIKTTGLIDSVPKKSCVLVQSGRIQCHLAFPGTPINIRISCRVYGFDTEIYVHLFSAFRIFCAQT